MRKGAYIACGVALAALLLAGAADTAGKRPVRAERPAVSEQRPQAYAGDCGDNPPPGYRHDLKDWRSGFTSRDFSCYMLD